MRPDDCEDLKQLQQSIKSLPNTYSVTSKSSRIWGKIPGLLKYATFNRFCPPRTGLIDSKKCLRHSLLTPYLPKNRL